MDTNHQSYLDFMINVLYLLDEIQAAMFAAERRVLEGARSLFRVDVLAGLRRAVWRHRVEVSVAHPGQM